MEIVQDFYLPNRDAVELAWYCMQTTGDAPTLTPLLDSMIDLLPPRQSADREQGAMVYLSGESAAVMKKELIHSLGHMVTYASQPETSQAASVLLQKLEV